MCVGERVKVGHAFFLYVGGYLVRSLLAAMIFVLQNAKRFPMRSPMLSPKESVVVSACVL